MRLSASTCCLRQHWLFRKGSCLDYLFDLELNQHSRQLGNLHLQSGKYTKSSKGTVHHLFKVLLPDSILNFNTGPTAMCSPNGEPRLRHEKQYQGMDALGLHIWNILWACLAQAYIPTTSRHAKMLFISKQAKSDANIKISRPIDLNFISTKTTWKTSKLVSKRYIHS